MALYVPAGLESASGIDNIEYLEKGEHKDGALKIVLLNLMPDVEQTEGHYMSVLAASGIDIELTLMKTATYTTSRCPKEHFDRFYSVLDDIRDNYYDGVILNGAPLAYVKFEDVFFKDEFQEICAWSEAHATSVLYICWSGFAKLYYDFGIDWLVSDNFYGIYPNKINAEDLILTGLEDGFLTPYSRETSTLFKDAQPAFDAGILTLLVTCPTGPALMRITGTNHFICLYHLEYDRYRLDFELRRNRLKDPSSKLPVNYYPDDDMEKEPPYVWRENAVTFYGNWVRYYAGQGRV